MNIQKYKKQFEEVGFFLVPNFFSEKCIESLRLRLNQIILGEVALEGRRFQLDSSSGSYEELDFSNNIYAGPDKVYRKIADLEYDEVFLEALQSSGMKSLCNDFVGEEISIMRVTMMDKAAHGGTRLPFHQDLSLDWPISKMPSFIVWFPLDHAMKESGTLEVIPRSHRSGVIGRGHQISRENLDSLKKKYGIVRVECRAGDCLFFHPALIHGSGRNETNMPRRSINAVLFKGASQNTKTGKFYPFLFGKDPLKPCEVAKLSQIPS